MAAKKPKAKPADKKPKAPAAPKETKPAATPPGPAGTATDAATPPADPPAAQSPAVDPPPADPPAKEPLKGKKKTGSYVATSPIRKDGREYAIGDDIELTDEQAAELKACGAIAS